MAAIAVVVVPPATDEARAQEDPCAEASAAPFADRDEIAVVHRQAVDCLWHLGIVRGSPDSDGQARFAPRAEVSRAQFAGMVHATLDAVGRADGLTEPRRPRFRDVHAGHTFDHVVHTLAQAGLVDGVDADSFAPDRPLRRDQTASLLVRAAEWATDQPLTAVAGPHFGDIAGSVHRDAIEAAFEYGLVEGIRRPCGDAGGRYSPGAATLRLLTEVVPEQRWGIGEVETDGWTQHFKGGWGSGTGSVDHQVVLLEYEDGTRVALAVMTTSSPSHDYGKTTLRGVFDRILSDLP